MPAAREALGVHAYELPLKPPERVSELFDNLLVLGLTSNSRDGNKISRWTILQEESDIRVGSRPGNVEWSSSSDTGVIRVGELGGLGVGNESRNGEELDGELHFYFFGFF